MRIAELYSDLSEQMKDYPERDEELLRIFMHVLGMERHEFILSKNQEIDPLSAQAAAGIVKERLSGRPLAHILGYTYFYGERFPVSTETLIPRYDTEILIEAMEQYCPKDKHFSLLDICTGTGIIAFTAAKLFPRASIKALDIVDAPFLNSKQFLGDGRVEFEKCDFLDRSTWTGHWDYICSNPPYLNAEDTREKRTTPHRDATCKLMCNQQHMRAQTVHIETFL